MGWLWGSSQRKLTDDETAKLQRKFSSERRAYASCIKANKHNTSFCEMLETRLLERWSESVAPEAAAAFQQCYTISLMRDDERLDSCSKEVEAMKKCLSNLGVNPVA